MSEKSIQPERISVPELIERIEKASSLKNLLLQLRSENKKLIVEISPEYLDDMPSSSNILFTKHIIPVYLRRGGNMELYSPNPRGKPRVSGLGYRNSQRARNSIKRIRGKTRKYQKQTLRTLYYRAKHHPRKTQKMSDAMKIFKKRLQNLETK